MHMNSNAAYSFECLLKRTDGHHYSAQQQQRAARPQQQLDNNNNNNKSIGQQQQQQLIRCILYSLSRRTTAVSRRTTAHQPRRRDDYIIPVPIMSDNGEAPVFYPDARDGLLTSAADARRKALKHLDCFLVGYCKQINIKQVKGDDIPNPSKVH